MKNLLIIFLSLLLTVAAAQPREKDPPLRYRDCPRNLKHAGSLPVTRKAEPAVMNLNYNNGAGGNYNTGALCNYTYRTGVRYDTPTNLRYR